MEGVKSLVAAAGGYLRQHPEELVRVAKNAVGLRVGVPIAALRWLAEQLKAGAAPKDLEIDSEPPGIRVAASFTLLGTPLRAGAVVTIDEVRFGRGELRIKVRLNDVRMKVLDDTVETPVAALIRSGALDLSKPGNLAAYMPRRPAFLVEARDDFVVVDLAKHPKFATPRAGDALTLLASLLSIRSVETDWDHLDVALHAFPMGVGDAWGALRRFL